MTINVTNNNGRCMLRFKCPISQRTISKTHGSFTSAKQLNLMQGVAISIEQAIIDGSWTGDIGHYMPESAYVKPTSLKELLELKAQQTDDNVVAALLNKLQRAKEPRTSDECLKWLESMDASASTFNRYRGAIGAVAPKLVESFARKRIQRKPPNPLNEREQVLLTKFVSNSKWSHLIPFWLKCGFRNGEISALLYTDFQQDRGQYFVSVSKSMVKGVVKPMPKNKVHRKVYLSESDWRKFRGPYKGTSNLYGDMDWSGFASYAWRPMMEELGIPYRPPYVLRSTAISNYLHAGNSLAETSSTFGTGLAMLQNHYVGLISTPSIV